MVESSGVIEQPWTWVECSNWMRMRKRLRLGMSGEKVTLALPPSDVATLTEPQAIELRDELTRRIAELQTRRSCRNVSPGLPGS
ncbi:hypothetical protein BJ970_005670 [Saccharopolyspora phatthalungensis]|uniref:Uncharacterized protein n=1 Tax=Saccharopolyspora phatthalungensis TaxID=664693 RepID=A0A840QDQ9_9PSEU|nr:hypothetical protein [Saccharopolyspora phatthalungensis]